MVVGFKCQPMPVRSVDQFNGDFFFFIGKSTQRVSEVVQSDNQSVYQLVSQSVFLFIQSGSQSVSLNKIICHFKSLTQLIILNYPVLIIPNYSPFFYSRFVLQPSEFQRDSTQDSERSLWCFYQSQFHSQQSLWKVREQNLMDVTNHCVTHRYKLRTKLLACVASGFLCPTKL